MITNTVDVEGSAVWIDPPADWTANVEDNNFGYYQPVGSSVSVVK